jgi:DNA mismatch repair protein MSH4
VLTRGKTQEKNYGVFLAEMSTLPSDVVTEAKEILQHLQKSKQDPGHKEDLLKFQRSHFQLSSHLIQLAKNSKLNHQGLVAYMKFLKEKYSWLKDQQVLCSTEE